MVPETIPPILEGFFWRLPVGPKSQMVRLLTYIVTMKMAFFTSPYEAFLSLFSPAYAARAFPGKRPANWVTQTSSGRSCCRAILSNVARKCTKSSSAPNLCSVGFERRAASPPVQPSAPTYPVCAAWVHPSAVPVRASTCTVVLDVSSVAPGATRSWPSMYLPFPPIFEAESCSLPPSPAALCLSLSCWTWNCLQATSAFGKRSHRCHQVVTNLTSSERSTPPESSKSMLQHNSKYKNPQ